MKLFAFILWTFFLSSLAAPQPFVGTGGPYTSSWNRVEFTSIGDPTSPSYYADPCHLNIQDIASDCYQDNLPDSSVTALVPADVYYPLYRTTTSSWNSFNGHFVVGNAVVTTLNIALSSVGGRCSSIQANTVILATTTAIRATLNSADANAPNWFSRLKEFEEMPRAICYSLDGITYKYTGLKWKVTYATVSASCPPPTTNTATDLAKFTDPANVAIPAHLFSYPMNDTYKWLKQQQTLRTTTSKLGVLTCYNSNVKSECGGYVYDLFTQTCCNTNGVVTTVPVARVVWKDAPCPCVYPFDSTGTRVYSDSQCPGTQVCCLPTKYSGFTYQGQIGQCYAPGVHGCCNTGKRYNPGTSQCCPINGVQGLDIPCPCSKDSDCNDALTNFGRSGFSCCMQSTPTPQEYNVSDTSSCSIWANFPSGTGIYSAQACTGSCINANFQQCCNGVACLKANEYCCNSTCCNRYVGTCSIGRRSGAPGNRYNPTGFGAEYIQCQTTYEQLNTVKAFWIFVLPTELMFVSFFGLAICLAFAARAKDNHSYSVLERVLLLSAVLTILFSVTTFFAPIYKYGVVVVVVSLLAIITAAARVRWLTVMCIFFHVVALIYLFDFVDGNYYLGLPSNRDFGSGIVDVSTSGVLHAIKKMFNDTNDVEFRRFNVGWCVSYYKYFQWDSQLRDTERFDNPEVNTFGYCSRAWSVALFLFVAAILDLVILQLILSILALIVRFQHSKEVVEVVEEVPIAEQKILS